MIECPRGQPTTSRVSSISSMREISWTLSSLMDLSAHPAERNVFFIGILTRNPAYLMVQLGRKLNTYGRICSNETYTRARIEKCRLQVLPLCV